MHNLVQYTWIIHINFKLFEEYLQELERWWTDRQTEFIKTLLQRIKKITKLTNLLIGLKYLNWIIFKASVAGKNILGRFLIGTLF